MVSLDDLSTKICALRKTKDMQNKDIYANLFNMITKINEVKILTNCISCNLDSTASLYVLFMSCTRFRVNPHSIVASMSRNSCWKQNHLGNQFD